ncbi:hypothetical protein SNE40_012178 [Patella caerulea]|uniref:Integrin beta subunit tail domain-containing protein n=1 Tax=Patella caerulea TaxID=87958 RepID=A0AAN8JPB2_PATCE
MINSCIKILCLYLFLNNLHQTDGVCDSSSLTCNECFSNNEPQDQCGWCKQMNFTQARCGRINDLQTGGCPRDRIEVKNMGLGTTIRRNEDLSPLIPIRPQSAFITIPVNSARSIEFQMRAEKRWLIFRVSSPRNIQVEVTSSCNRFRWRNNGRGRCSRLTAGQTVNFRLILRAEDCSTSGSVIVSIPRSSQKFLVDVESSCGCECSKRVTYRAPQCSTNGNLVCGQCECDEGYVGRYCFCHEMEDNPESCRERPGGAICSNRGSCKCGVCDCRSRNPDTNLFYGRFCECNDYSCSRFNGRLCGGPERGSCHCGRCVCNPGYSGEMCELATSSSTASCRALNGEICNGRGDCIYGRCRCSSLYMGPTCEDCPTCNGQCSVLKDCVRCTIYRSGPLSEEQCYSQCRIYGIQPVDTVNEYDPDMKLCMFVDDDSCQYKFVYGLDEDGELVVRARLTKICPGSG